MAGRVALAVVLLVALNGAQAAAQTTTSAPAKPSSSQAQGSSSENGESETRPATTTFLGDTGFWFVPTGAILPGGKWSVSGYRAGFNDQQGFTNYSFLAPTFAVGVGNRVEFFTSWRLITRIDRDSRPLFTPDPAAGGLENPFPFVTTGWTGNKVGDLYVGAKVNLASEWRPAPLDFAVRGIVKVPTGDRDAGASTGKTDVAFDVILSKEASKAVELSAYAGYIFRGQPDTPSVVSVANGFRWGFGAGFPSRSPLRVTAELFGEKRSADTITAGTPLVATDFSVSPATSSLRNPTIVNLGLTWQSKRGFFIGAGVNYVFTGDSADSFANVHEDSVGRLRDYADFQVRIGFHPGTRVFVPPPPPPPAPPPPPPAPAVHRPPTVRATCDPCTVEVGQRSTVTADGRSPDNLPLTYRWTAPTGTLADPSQVKTIWTAPNQEGPVPVTVTVDDGQGGTASDTVTIQVVRPPQKVIVFEDVHFDFDQYTLTSDATRLLDEAVTAMQQNPQLRITIEGHTCDIGSPEYNLALGERRANAARDYLVSRGIATDRMRTVSYGEERPKYDNSREETRRLNRRAALVVIVQ